jgi:hypothetical protein
MSGTPLLPLLYGRICLQQPAQGAKLAIEATQNLGSDRVLANQLGFSRAALGVDDNEILPSRDHVVI